jgi:hypothetical protein
MSCASRPPSHTSRHRGRRSSLCLPPALLERIFWQLKQDQLVEILGQV